MVIKILETSPTRREQVYLWTSDIVEILEILYEAHDSVITHRSKQYTYVKSISHFHIS